MSTLSKLGTPIARINAAHSGAAASATPLDQAEGLELVIFLAKNAKVMLTSNLWLQVGLCNGAMGIVESILYAEGHKPPAFPIAVMVNFNNYTGPPFLPSKA